LRACQSAEQKDGIHSKAEMAEEQTNSAEWSRLPEMKAVGMIF
jgi:hypothetical protein